MVNSRSTTSPLTKRSSIPSGWTVITGHICFCMKHISISPTLHRQDEVIVALNSPGSSPHIEETSNS
jgi:hypothetical protein